MAFEPLTTEKLIELIKDLPKDTIVNIDYQNKGFTSNIEVQPDIGNGATGSRNIVFLEANKPRYIK